MKKILILGSDSMSGHLIMKFFLDKNEYDLIGIKEEKFQLFTYNFINDIQNIKPDFVINTLRKTILNSENNPSGALFYNSFIPKWFETYYINTKTKIIHLSTDCVFSGLKGSYSESDYPDGTNTYSISKFCGEINNSKDLTIRTSYIGPNLINRNEELFDWFLKQKNNVDGYNNVYWNGVTTLELAKNIYKAIKNDISGLYHLCSERKISKFKLLSIIKKIFSLDIMINNKKSKKLDRSLIDSRKKINLINYNEMFFELYDFMLLNKNIYGHYDINFKQN